MFGKRVLKTKIFDPRLGQDFNPFGDSILANNWLCVERDIVDQQEAAVLTKRVLAHLPVDRVFFLHDTSERRAEKHNRMLEQHFGLESLPPRSYFIIQPPTLEFVKKCSEALVLYENWVYWSYGGFAQEKNIESSFAKIPQDMIDPEDWAFRIIPELRYFWFCDFDNPDVTLVSTVPEDFDGWIELLANNNP